MSAHCPYRWTGRRARKWVDLPARRWASTCAGSRFKVCGSTSRNTGRAPARTMALAEAKKLKAVVITSSPGCTPAAASASQSASVPDAHPIAWAAPVNAATSCSRASTSAPRMKCCDEQTRSTAARISSRISAYWRDRSSMGTAGGVALFFEIEAGFTDHKILAGRPGGIIPDDRFEIHRGNKRSAAAAAAAHSRR